MKRLKIAAAALLVLAVVAMVLPAMASEPVDGVTYENGQLYHAQWLPRNAHVHFGPQFTGKRLQWVERGADGPSRVVEITNDNPMPWPGGWDLVVDGRKIAEVGCSADFEDLVPTRPEVEIPPTRPGGELIPPTRPAGP